MCRIANLPDNRIPDIQEKREKSGRFRLSGWILSIQDEIQLVAYAYIDTAHQYSLVYFLVGRVSGIIRPLPTNGGMEELHRDLTVRPPPKVWTRSQKWKKYCQR